MPDFFDDRRPHQGFSYAEYRGYWKQEKSGEPDGSDPAERRMHHYLNYNWDRQASVHDQYEPSDALASAVEAIDAPQLWMAITEPWCGDSAFLLPVIAEAAAWSDSVAFRILLRDDNLDIMDQYLTGGSRSIPKLVAFSEEGDELFTWGPRPEGAAARFEELSDEHDAETDVISGLVDYYANGGWKESDTELARTLEDVTAPSSPASHEA